MSVIESEGQDPCPRCARRPILETSEAGWCSVCVVDAAAQHYIEAEGARSAARLAAWAERTGALKGRADSSTALRQHRSKLLKKTRPREPDPGKNPLELAAGALTHLARIRSALGTHHRVLADVDALAEIVRRLGWGPD